MDDAFERGQELIATYDEELRKELHRFVRVHNERSAKPFVWKAKAEAILASVAEARKVLGYGI